MSALTESYERNERTLKSLVDVRLELIDEREKLVAIKQLADNAPLHDASDFFKRELQKILEGDY